MFQCFVFAAFVFCWSAIGPSQVDTSSVVFEPPAYEFLGIEFHGFVSQGGFVSTHNRIFDSDSTEGSVAFTEVGLNLMRSITTDLSAGMQFFARLLGEDGTFVARFDWFYLDYRFDDALGIRVGRTKLPYGLFNEINDVDVARVPILLPQGVYPIDNRDFLLAQTGVELYGYAPIGSLGALDYRLYGGTILFDSFVFGGGGSGFDLRTRYIVGGRLIWETPLAGLHVSGSLQYLRNKFEFPSSRSPEPVTGSIPALLWVLSTEYLAGDFHAAAEYSRWHYAFEPDAGPRNEVVAEQFYLLMSYRFAPWFQPGAYYSVVFPNLNQGRTTRTRYRLDLAVTLRFDINTFWLVKLEGHYLNGTAGLSSGQNDGVPASALDKHWSLFLAKTTLYF